MLNHLTINVANLAASKTFYTTALAPLGLTCLFTADGYCGLGVDRPIFWLSQADATHPQSTNLHLAFTAESAAAVTAFHAAALQAGGTDNGVPGLRSEYHATYFAGFIIDPNGHNLEAVFGNG
ncbi:TPA: glyoxalase/bleomycin resistance/extradiol dioxygenase family protein [Candidatus Uhrbacteria bacterium]|nr:glyoxalase/bleomycin resistance/extradiol dioxygenase family protein [Candidatus Uhrbacteria bacterium]